MGRRPSPQATLPRWSHARAFLVGLESRYP
jgi:hypothetical protein